MTLPQQAAGADESQVLPAENRIDERSPPIKALVPRLFWLIVKDEARRIDVLTSRLTSGEEALPVFSFEDEARMFLELGALGGDWRVRVTTPGELISVLFCLCASVKRVALDPLPHPDGAALNHLMSMEREAFMRFAGKQGYGAASSSIAWGNRIGQIGRAGCRILACKTL